MLLLTTWVGANAVYTWSEIATFSGLGLLAVIGMALCAICSIYDPDTD